MIRLCTRMKFAVRATIWALMFISIGLIAVPSMAQQAQPS